MSTMTRDSYAYLQKMGDCRMLESILFRMKAEAAQLRGETAELELRCAASYESTAADYRRWAAAAPDAPKVAP